MSPLRTALALCLSLGTLATAQPSNDTCAGALPIPATVGFARSRSPVSKHLGANPLPETPLSCAVGLTNSTVWYSFTPTESGRYEFQTCDETAPGTYTSSTTTLAVYGGFCDALQELANACNDDWCGNQARVVVNLTAGVTYFLQTGLDGVHTTSSNLPDADDAVQLSVIKTSGAETCAGPVPELPFATTLPISTTATDVNDSQVGGGAACYAGLGQTTVATTQLAAGRDRVHRFTAPRTGSYNFHLGETLRTADGALYLTDSCVAASMPPQTYSPPQCISASNRSTTSTSAHEEVSCVPLTAGQQVYVWVDEGTAQSSPAPGASFSLEVSECVTEAEPNNDPASAASLACGLTGAINAAADVDFYALPPAPAGSRVFAMVEAAAANTNALQMRVTTATSTVEMDDNDLDLTYGGSAPGVAGTQLSAAPHFLRVNANTASAVVQPYHVYSVVQTGTAQAEVEPNDAPGSANSGPLNYFSGAIPDVNDVDFYAFQATEGSLVYLSLDSQPGRNSTTSTCNHTLSLWNDEGELLLINDSTVAVNNTAPAAGLVSNTPTSPSEHLLFRIPKTGVYWARVGRTSSTVTATNTYLLSIAVNCGSGNGIDTPSLTSLTPAAGSSLGGEEVTLTGTGFGSGSVVTFDGRAATFVSSTPTQLVVRTPIGDDGPADVEVKNFGRTAVSLAAAFTYSTPAQAPTVTAVTPASGSSLGGQAVTVHGTLFKPGAQVFFDVGGVVQPGTAVNVVNIAELRVTTPAHAAGLASVTVRNTDALEGSLSAAYRFVAPPVITGVSPSSGLLAGGTVVTVTGTGFSPNALIRFGPQQGLNVTIDPSGTSLTATTAPSALNSAVDVIVINPDNQRAVRVDGFRYLLPGPTLSSVSPDTGAASGGTTITLTGSNFATAPTVLVGGAIATDTNLVSSTVVTAFTPPGTSGAADVVIVNTDDQRATLTGGFVYAGPPIVSSITPASGPSLGGTRITITGADFQPGLLVRIGGAPAFAATMVSPTTATATTPSSVPGAADVEVLNADGQRGVLAGGYTFEGGPVLRSLSPSIGSTTGGTVVTLTGSGFASGAEVRFGNLPATGVTVVSPAELTAVAPAAPMSVVGVTVRNTDGQSSTLPSAFRYVDAPALASLLPTSGDVSGGTVVRLTGSGFSVETRVLFGGMASPLVTLVNATTLDAVTPSGAPGPVDVSVANPDGATTTLSAAYTFTRPAPVIAGLSPASGPTTGGTLVSISGSGFAPNVTVTVGGAPVTDVVLASGELLRGRLPAHAAGAVDVVVSNDDGQSATLASGFTYIAPADGNLGVADGGNGGLGSPPDGGTGTNMPTGCGCSGVEGSVLMFAALGLLLRRRRVANEDAGA